MIQAARVRVYPVIAPVGLMLQGKVPDEPGTSNVVMFPLLSRTKP